MPSPFPGMDPWLESATEWPGFHDILIVETVAVLQPELRKWGYYANPGERGYLVEPGRPTYPDVVLIRRPTSTSLPAAAVAEPDEPVLIRKSQVEVHEGVVEIYDSADNRLITGIEYLSPANKPAGVGRDLYEQKQEEMRDAGVHLVEVDFIRRGPHVLDVPINVADALKPWNYLVNLARRGTDQYALYPIGIAERLPRIRIPLKQGDEDAILNLQDVFERSYAIGRYPERLDYTAPPPPPELDPDDAAWADELLKSKGLRK